MIDYCNLSRVSSFVFRIFPILASTSPFSYTPIASMSVTKVNGLLHYNAVGRWLTVTPLVASAQAILYLADSDRQVKNLADSYRLWSRLVSEQRQIITWAEAESALPALTSLLNNEHCLIIA